MIVGIPQHHLDYDLKNYRTAYSLLLLSRSLAAHHRLYE
jgi:hypothetical protein